jgi:hypothetical protein
MIFPLVKIFQTRISAPRARAGVAMAQAYLQNIAIMPQGESHVVTAITSEAHLSHFFYKY